MLVVKGNLPLESRCGKCWSMARSRRPSRGTYHHGDLRRAAVARASEVAASQGIDAVGLRSLARDLGVTHAALTHHFGERRALLQAVARDGFDALAEAMEGAARGAATPPDRARAIGAAYLGVARRLPGHFRVMFGREIIPQGEALPDELERSSSRAFAALIGTFGVEHLDARTLAAWAGAHGLAILSAQGPLLEHAGSAAALEALILETLEVIATRLSATPPP